MMKVALWLISLVLLVGSSAGRRHARVPVLRKGQATTYWRINRSSCNSRGEIATSFIPASTTTRRWRQRTDCLRTARRTDLRSRSPCYHQRAKDVHCSLTMLRNVDLPEAIVFYGLDTVLDTPVTAGTSNTVAAGVERLLHECRELGTSAMLLSETGESLEQIKSRLEGTTLPDLLQVRCQLEPPPVEVGEDEDELYPWQASPSPAFLLNSLRTVSIIPRGFGGSSGFGVQPRSNFDAHPTPTRTVVFVTTYHQCCAALGAGMRCIYLDNAGNDENAANLADGVMDSIGNADVDWHLVTLDAISTPGDFWLNPPSSRDADASRVSPDDLVLQYEKQEKEEAQRENHTSSSGSDMRADVELEEEEMARILADLDSL